MTRVSAIEGHALWAPVYDSGPNPLLHLERRSMNALLQDLRPSVMIDVACGTGSWLLHFLQGGTKVFGIDACEPMLREAERNRSLRGRFSLGEAESLPFRARTANLVLCSMSLGYFQDLVQIFQEFSRVSMPGAYIAVSDLHPAAIDAGWTRSFKRGEHHYELATRFHSLEEVSQAAFSAGLRFRSQEVAYIADPEFSILRSAGKEKLFRTLTSIPALFLSLWEKPC
jgi:ubiquinone/menaquinone biosynthesis C-methylase UbiE